jgi:membrane dipeptidase
MKTKPIPIEERSRMRMKRRDFVKGAGLAAVSFAVTPISFSQTRRRSFDPLNEKGIHPLFEEDPPFLFIDSCMQMWPDARFGEAHRYGAAAYAVTAWDPHSEVDQALEELMFWHLVARKYPHLLVASRAEDITQANKNGKAVLLLASQCGDFIGYELHRIEAFYKLGLRMLVPAYSATNQICSCCLDRTDDGLTSFGKRVVEECNRVGLLLDCSHVGLRSSLEIIERSRKPVVFSHSSVKALADNPRNITDVQIKACAVKGGVIGLCPWGPLILKEGATSRPTLAGFVEHIDHVVQLLGSTDNIGIGTDMSIGTYPDHEYDPWGSSSYKDVTSAYDEHITANIRSPLRMVDGFSNYSEVLNLVESLKKRGFGTDDIRKILGTNYLRVFKEVWAE